MNRSEPVVHDVDIYVDAQVSDDLSMIAWDQVTEEEASSIGLDLGLYREALHDYEKRRASWGTATGGVISMSVVGGACVAVGTGPWTALGIVLLTQLVRVSWLYWKTYKAGEEVLHFQGELRNATHRLSQVHPAKNT